MARDTTSLAGLQSIGWSNSVDRYPERHRAGDAGLPLLLIENRLGRAVIALQGAQVLEFQPAGGPQRLWLSPNAILRAGMPVRGGIPLCVPWFGPGPDGTSAHGFARVLEWKLIAAEETEDGATRIVLELTGSAATHALWPHAFCFRLELIVGRSLHLSFSAENRSDDTAPLAFIFHTYFSVEDIRACRVRGLEGTAYLDKTDGGARKQEPAAVAIDGTTDRVYLDVPALQILDCPDACIRIESDARCAVVWNAGTNDRNLSDLGEGTHKTYLCVERGDVADHAIRLEGRQTYRMHMTLHW